jgi:hypothetical protein
MPYCHGLKAFAKPGRVDGSLDALDRCIGAATGILLFPSAKHQTKPF